jgi:hypothetical protein
MMKDWDPMDLEWNHEELDGETREVEIDTDEDGINIELDF